MVDSPLDDWYSSIIMGAAEIYTCGRRVFRLFSLEGAHFQHIAVTFRRLAAICVYFFTFFVKVSLRP